MPKIPKNFYQGFFPVFQFLAKFSPYIELFLFFKGIAWAQIVGVSANINKKIGVNNDPKNI